MTTPQPLTTALRLVRARVMAALEGLAALEPASAAAWGRMTKAQGKALQDGTLRWVAVAQSQDGGGQQDRWHGALGWSGLVAVKVYAANDANAQAGYDLVVSAMRVLVPPANHVLFSTFDRPIFVPTTEQDLVAEGGQWLLELRVLSQPTLTPAQRVRQAILALAPPLYWPLDEASGTQFANIGTTSGATGLFFNFAQMGVSAPPFVAARLGVTNGSLAFGNANASTSGTFDGNVGSALLWLRGGGGATAPLCQFLAPPVNGTGINVRGTGTPTGLTVDRIVAGQAVSLAITRPNATSWALIAFTWNQPAGWLRASVNAGPQAETAATAPLNPLGSFVQLSLSGHASDPLFAHIALFPTLLTPVQIASVWTAAQ